MTRLMELVNGANPWPRRSRWHRGRVAKRDVDFADLTILLPTGDLVELKLRHRPGQRRVTAACLVHGTVRSQLGLRAIGDCAWFYEAVPAEVEADLLTTVRAWLERVTALAYGPARRRMEAPHG